MCERVVCDKVVCDKVVCDKVVCERAVRDKVVCVCGKIARGKDVRAKLHVGETCVKDYA